MAWERFRRVDSSANPWDRHEGAEGVAEAWLDYDRAVVGQIDGRPFGPVGRPPSGNIQALRIVPRAEGWCVFVWTDPDDEHREVWREVVAPR